MPFVWIDRVIVDPLRCTEGGSSIGAARKHHIRSAARADACYHINVVIGGTAGAVDGKENLAGEPAWVDRAAKNQGAAHVNCRNLVKSGRDTRVLCVGRPNAPEAAAGIPATDKKVAIAGHIERSPLRRVGNADRSLPRCSGISRTTEPSELTSVEFGPKLVLKTVAHAGRGPVNGEPFLVTAMGASVGRLLRPGLAAIRGEPDVGTKAIHQQAKVEKIASLIGVCHRVATEHARLQCAREMPRETGISGVAIAGLAEIRLHRIELSPADCSRAAVRWINRNRGLVRRVPEDVVSIRVNVDLIADKRPVL